MPPGCRCAESARKPGRLVEGSVARVQQMARRMIDIEQDSVEFPARSVGIETVRGARAGEKIGLQHAGSADHL